MIINDGIIVVYNTIIIFYKRKYRRNFCIILIIFNTLIGREIPRITEVQGIPIEANFAPKILYVRNYDKPGFIGSIGTLLAKNKINIGSFHLGRRENSGEAIAILSIDQEVNNHTMKNLLNLEHVVRVDYMKF